MRIQVRFFASLVERVGAAHEVLDVDPGLDVAGLWTMLTERHPALGRLGYRPLVACDLEYSGWDRGLEGVGEVAFLPPVSGG